jgi:hypothetical protein
MMQETWLSSRVARARTPWRQLGVIVLVVSCGGSQFSGETGDAASGGNAGQGGGAGESGGGAAGQTGTGGQAGSAGQAGTGGGTDGGIACGSATCADGERCCYGCSPGSGFCSNGPCPGFACPVPVDAAPTECASGKVTLQMKGTAASSDYCIGADCSWEWLTISTANGEALSRSHECVSDCADCRLVGCTGSCAAPRQMQPDGETAEWDGTYWVGGATCGSGVACADKRCAPPGKYIAKMCAYANQTPDGVGACGSGSARICVDVEFNLPAADAVVGRLGLPQ